MLLPVVRVNLCRATVSISESADRCKSSSLPPEMVITTAVRNSSRTDLHNIILAFLSVFASGLDLRLGFKFVQCIIRHYFSADEPPLKVCVYGTSSLHRTYTQTVLNPKLGSLEML